MKRRSERKRRKMRQCLLWSQQREICESVNVFVWERDRCIERLGERDMGGGMREDKEWNWGWNTKGGCVRVCVHTRCVSAVPKVLLAVFSYWLVHIDLAWHIHSDTHTHAQTQHGWLDLAGLWHRGTRGYIVNTHESMHTHPRTSFGPLKMTTIFLLTHTHARQQSFCLFARCSGCLAAETMRWTGNRQLRVQTISICDI